MATIEELLTHKQEQDELRRKALNARANNASWRAHNPNAGMFGVLTPAEMSKAVRITRAKVHAEAAKAEAHERKHRTFMNALRKTRWERDACISNIRSLTTIRKDGKNVAKPHCKDARAKAQAELARINKHITRYEAELAHLRHMENSKPEREPSRFQRMQQRNMLIHEILQARNGDNVDRAREECMYLNETFCRPRNGYPNPPHRRTELYPVGGALGHRKEDELKRVQGEHARLMQYGSAMARVYKGTFNATVHMYEGANGKPVCVTRQRVLLNIAHQLVRLNNLRVSLGDEKTVRRAGKHYYKLMLDSRVAKILGM